MGNKKRNDKKNGKIDTIKLGVALFFIIGLICVFGPKMGFIALVTTIIKGIIIFPVGIFFLFIGKVVIKGTADDLKNNFKYSKQLSSKLKGVIFALLFVGILSIPIMSGVYAGIYKYGGMLVNASLDFICQDIKEVKLNNIHETAEFVRKRQTNYMISGIDDNNNVLQFEINKELYDTISDFPLGENRSAIIKYYPRTKIIYKYNLM